MTPIQPTNQSSSPESATRPSKFDLILGICQRLLQRGALANLGNLLNRMHPADIAKVLEHLSEPNEGHQAFDLIRPQSKQGQVLSEMDVGVLAPIVNRLSLEELVSVLKDLGPDDVAYILGTQDSIRAQDILGRMRTEDSTEIAEILQYPKDTAGGIMTTECLTVLEDVTAREAIRLLQEATDAEMVFYLYVVDSQEQLVGVVSLRDLLTAVPEAMVQDIMSRDVISVTVEMDQEEVARQVANYNLLAIPVVNANNQLLGIITVDDVIDVIREEATEDMFKMAGAVDEHASVEFSSIEAARHRLPWIFTNLIGSLISGGILWIFRYTLQEVVAIVSFIPVIAAMGGNVGLQSSTLIIRGLAMGRIENSDLQKVLYREIRIGLLLGLICGGLLSLIGWGWHGGGFLGLVVGIALLVAFLVSTSLATILPFVLNRLKIDPAVAAGPFVTTANDITGITIYLSLATSLLGYLK